MKSMETLYQKIKQIQKQRIVIAGADDEPVIDAVYQAYQLGVVEPILIGDGDKIKFILEKYPNFLSKITLVDCKDLDQVAKLAVQYVKNNQADVLMKGLIDTKILLKAVVDRENGIRSGKIISHVGVASYPDFDRVLFFTDAAMLIAPSVDERIAVINNALELVYALGYIEPKVGLVSAVEKVNLKMQSTIDAQSIVERKSELAYPCLIDGPFAIDNLVSLEASIHKGITSPVAGKADILVFPTIEAGNVFYKTSVFLAHADVAGIILGATHPIVLTSRADSAQAKLNSIILAAVYQYEKNISH